MAQRYGGKYSPNAAQPGAPVARTSPVGARANLLFIPAIPMVFMSLNDGAVSMVAGLVAAGILTLAAWLLRGGLQAEAEYNARKVARKPAIPRKMFSSILTGVGIAIAAWRNDPGLVAPILYGAAAAGLHIAAFGIDPLKSKGMEGIDTFQQDRVARVVDEAETHLAAMTDALKRTGDRVAQDRLAQFQTTARTLIRTVEEDPRDLTAARKYLSVYLMGAREATNKFADIFSRSRSPEAREDYIELLDDLDKNFNARNAKLLLDDKSDLNIEIEVLRERLEREGLRL
jgi:hypothetical protein